MTDAESLEQAIHETVALYPYSPEWPALFATERDRLIGLFPSLVAVEHIGSTAVEGMTAKPIIDLLAGVASMEAARSVAEPLCLAGYTTSVAFNATLTDRQWFMRWANGHRTHHLHVVVHEGTVWRDRLAFRDALRTGPELAADYLYLKMRLASAHTGDREAYTDAKSSFVQSVVARAQASSQNQTS